MRLTKDDRRGRQPTGVDLIPVPDAKIVSASDRQSQTTIA